jgi:hypothetical protein
VALEERPLLLLERFTVVMFLLPGDVSADGTLHFTFTTYRSEMVK